MNEFWNQLIFNFWRLVLIGGVIFFVFRHWVRLIASLFVSGVAFSSWIKYLPLGKDFAQSTAGSLHVARSSGIVTRILGIVILIPSLGILVYSVSGSLNKFLMSLVCMWETAEPLRAVLLSILIAIIAVLILAVGASVKQLIMSIILITFINVLLGRIESMRHRLILIAFEILVITILVREIFQQAVRL